MMVLAPNSLLLRPREGAAADRCKQRSQPNRVLGKLVAECRKRKWDDPPPAASTAEPAAPASKPIVTESVADAIARAQAAARALAAQQTNFAGDGRATHPGASVAPDVSGSMQHVGPSGSIDPSAIVAAAAKAAAMLNQKTSMLRVANRAVSSAARSVEPIGDMSSAPKPCSFTLRWFSPHSAYMSGDPAAIAKAAALAIGAQLTAKVEEEGKFKHEVDINNTPARYEFLRPGRRDEVRLRALACAYACAAILADSGETGAQRWSVGVRVRMLCMRV
jgi:hypothetical protein